MTPTMRHVLALAILLLSAACCEAQTPFTPAQDSAHVRAQWKLADSAKADIDRGKASLDRARARTDSMRNAEGYKTFPPSGPTGVAIAPGSSIQAAVDANPAGTAFVLKTGTHIRQQIVAKKGDTFTGEPGAVLDGENVTVYAFQGKSGATWIDSVTLKGFKIMRYASPNQSGAVWGGNDVTDGSTGWVLDSMEVTGSLHYGVRIGNRMKILNSNIHHNGTATAGGNLNIGGIGKSVLVDNTEIAYGNNGCVQDPGFESGGTKFVRTDSLIVRNSFIHHNCGVGLWLDIANGNYLLENNRTEDNVREGIAIEISFGGKVCGNTVLRNGNATDPFRTQNWLWDAGISVQASRDVEVCNNTVSDNFNGIVGIQQNRGTSNDPPGANYVLQGMNVHDNTIKQNIPQGAGLANAAAGIVQDNGDATVFTGRNNHYTHNTYTLIPLGGGQSPGFEWQGWKNDTQWKAIPNDATGTFTRTP